MSEEIINVLNYIGDKLGIAINWSSENVWPQVLDILCRYRVFQIVGLSIWLLVFMMFTIACIYFCNLMVKNFKLCSIDKKDNMWFYYSGYSKKAITSSIGEITIAIIAICAVIVLVAVPFITSEMLEWIFVPEVQYLEMLKTYMQ